jgi:hypothetical protein
MDERGQGIKVNGIIGFEWRDDGYAGSIQVHVFLDEINSI